VRYSKRVAVAAVVVSGVTAASALAVPPPPDASFSGDTSQTSAENHAVSLKTDANGHVSEVSIDWRAKCKRKGVFWTAGTTINAGPDGLPMQGDVFGDKGSYVSNASSKIKGKVSVTLAGQFSDENTASGNWRAKVTVFKKKHGKFRKYDKCKASITWNATRDA
jgi:hypothetical protein